MTNFQSNPDASGILKISGKISNYRCTRASASFIYTQRDQRRIGVVAITAALAGMGGQAASATALASNLDEPAEYIEFDLAGVPVKGWVWRSPFANGDIVDIAAEWQGDHFEAFGIARPMDRMIALYPHCSRSKGRHIRNTVKWWLICNAAFFGLMVTWFVYIAGPDILRETSFFWINGSLAVAFILMFASLARQYMPFVHVAERVFVILGLPDARNLDLVKSSKVQRTEQDSAEYGTYFYRY